MSLPARHSRSWSLCNGAYSFLSADRRVERTHVEEHPRCCTPNESGCYCSSAIEIHYPHPRSPAVGSYSSASMMHRVSLAVRGLCLRIRKLYVEPTAPEVPGLTLSSYLHRWADLVYRALGPGKGIGSAVAGQVRRERPLASLERERPPRLYRSTWPLVCTDVLVPSRNG